VSLYEHSAGSKTNLNLLNNIDDWHYFLNKYTDYYNRYLIYAYRKFFIVYNNFIL